MGWRTASGQTASSACKTGVDKLMQLTQPVRDVMRLKHDSSQGSPMYLTMTSVSKITALLAGLVLTMLALSACGDSRDTPATATNNNTSPALTPRHEIFGPTQRSLVRVSPDAQHIAWVERTPSGSQVWVALTQDLTARSVIFTSADDTRVMDYVWAGNSTHLGVVLQQDNTPKRTAVSVNILNQSQRPIATKPQSFVRLTHGSWDYPDDIILITDDQQPGRFDLYRVNVTTGAKRTVYRNTDGLTEFIWDSSLTLRVGYRPTPDGGALGLSRQSADDEWTTLARWSPEDAHSSLIFGFDASETGVYALDTTGRDTRAVIRIDLASRERQTLGAVSGADVDVLLIHPATNVLDGFSVERLRREWFATSPNGAEALDLIENAVGPNFRVTSRSLDDRIWTVISKDALGQYYVFDRTAAVVTPLFPSQTGTWVGGIRKPILIPAPDGLSLINHLTLPQGVDADGNGTPDTPLPLVIRIHDGPWSRVYAAYDPVDAWLADRGYAVLSLNPRGSTGLGKDYLNAGAGAWNSGVVGDIHAGARWAVEHQVAAPDQIALYGTLLGGYSSLAAMAQAPGQYQCGVAVAAPADLSTMIENTPARLALFKPMIARMIGDTTQAPALPSFASSITEPALIIQGDDDPLEQAEYSIELAMAAAQTGAPLNILRVDQVSRSSGDSPDLLLAVGAVETFFASCLGGDVEPLGDNVLGGNAKILHDTGGLSHVAKALDNAP